VHFLNLITPKALNNVAQGKRSAALGINATSRPMPTAQTPANLESPQTRMYACLRRFQVGRSLRCWHSYLRVTVPRASFASLTLPRATLF